MMIIDMHTHIFPDELAARAVAKLAEHAGVPAHTDGTGSGLRASMRRAGIARAALMPVATKPSQVRTINAWTAELNRSFPEFIGFGTLHPAQTDWAEEIARLTADGIRGIKLHHDYQKTFVDDAGFLPIYRALADAGLVLLVHAGVDIGLPPPVHCTPLRLARVLDAVPTLTVIAAHMGGYACWDEVEQYLIGRRLYLDTSYSLADLGAARMTALIRAHGVEQILFGSDSPWTDQQAEVVAINGLPFGDEELTAMLGGNARRLFGEV